MKKRNIILLLAAILAISLLAVCGSFLYQKISDDWQRKLSLDALATEAYQGVFFSMYDISTFSADDFLAYAGVETYKTDYPFSTAKQVNEAVEAVFSSDNRITNIYLGLDPLLLWHSEKEDISKVQETFEAGWLFFADVHPEVSFQVLFPFPSMDYWAGLEDGEKEAFYILLQQVTDILGGRANIKMFYPGSQKWLIHNPANYVNETVTNELVSQKIFLLTFCDQELQITPVNAAELVRQISDEVKAYQENPPEYPDLSDWDVVMMGDSIIGNYKGSISIPGVVNGLSGASAYNCAQGGTSAAEPAPDAICFPKMAEDFVNGTVRSETTYGLGIEEYLSDDHAGKKLCFLINYGTNDYFGGWPLENPEDKYDIGTYTGAMRTGISILREAYPDALYIMMGPGKVTYFEDGMEPQSDMGGVLTDYYEAAVAISEEMDVPYLDIYDGFPDGDDELLDILADGCHYNEYGRYLVGIEIVDFLEKCSTESR